MGAGNSAVVVDLPRCGPMLSPRVPNLVPIPGPWMQRETPGQRPRPNYGHPHLVYRISYRFLVPGWSAKPLVSASRPNNGHPQGTHNLDYGVRTNSVCPGVIDTPLLHDFRRHMTEKIIDWMVDQSGRDSHSLRHAPALW